MATSPVMRWLADGVPLTLLCDLASTRDPESQTVNLSERPPRDLTDPLVMATATAGRGPVAAAIAG